MKRLLTPKKLSLLMLALGVAFTVAFAQSNSAAPKQSKADTLPNPQKKIRDLDEALAEIGRSEVELQQAMKEIDQEKIEAEIRRAMKNAQGDMKKAKEEMANALKEIDKQKISLEVQKAMQGIDSEKIGKEVTAALSNIDIEKIKGEIEKAQQEMESIKETDFKKMQQDLAGIGPEIEKAMTEAKVEIEKAKKELNDYKNLVNALDKDGLLKKDGNYKIEYKNGELTVNGQTLSAQDTRRYSEHIGNKKDFILQKNADGLNINRN